MCYDTRKVRSNGRLLRWNRGFPGCAEAGRVDEHSLGSSHFFREFYLSTSTQGTSETSSEVRIRFSRVRWPRLRARKQLLITSCLLSVKKYLIPESKKSRPLREMGLRKEAAS